MRFLAQGPDIPAELLEARDQGEVVFFCGAGVSMPTGLPDFRRLARQVIRDLGVPAGDPAEALFQRAAHEDDPLYAPPMDQVFSLLQEAYGTALVEAAVSHRLRAPRRADLTSHQTILRLSADPEGRRRVVTTNFDPLFQRADRRLAVYTPPALPDLSYSAPLNGIVHLHGRSDVRLAPLTLQGLVLSTSDFGRAYLSQGWATRFMRQLLERYTLVLLGYTAEDAPVRYLLEGLNISGGSRRPIYAFSDGDPATVQGRWGRRGVRAIAYDPVDQGHSGLWESLSAWADRADNPAAWQAGVLALAQRGPLDLAAHERGQVASLVQTVTGAAAFRDAEPPPPAEWLAVFDARLRYARPGNGFLYGDEPDFDPLAVYGLDRDPPRPEVPKRDDPPLGEDLLAPMAGELNGAGSPGLASPGWAPLPPRLWELTLWCVRVLFQPAALWWAARQPALHPSLLDMIDRRLRRDTAAAHLHPRSAVRGAADHPARSRPVGVGLRRTNEIAPPVGLANVPPGTRP